MALAAEQAAVSADYTVEDNLTIFEGKTWASGCLMVLGIYSTQPAHLERAIE